jgi:DNA ligase (NAD+)
MSVTNLVAQIIDHATKYYTGNAEISDAEFDALVDRLRQEVPDHWILSAAGWGYTPSGKKVFHMGGHVGSLAKIKYPLTNAQYTQDCCVTPKLDGISVVCYFKLSGDMFLAATRGNGTVGVDVTDKLSVLIPSQVMVNIYNRYPDQLIAIRGEVIIPLRYEQELKDRNIPHPRNYAAGIMNRIGIDEDITLLEFVPYTVKIKPNDIKCYNWKDQTEEFQWLQDLGFKTPNIFKEDQANPERLKTIHNQLQSQYPIDGLVLQNKKGSIAYKFEGESAQAEIEQIIWSTGGKGKITPVIKLKEPVNISGASIINVSGHNKGFILKHKLGSGAIIEIIRSNEVIPYVTKVIKPVEQVSIPLRCPECKERLQSTEVDLFCVNLFCSSRAAESIGRFLHLVGIPEGLGETVITKYLALLDVKTIFDLFSFLKAGSYSLLDALKLNLKPHYGSLIYQLEQKMIKFFEDGVTYENFWYFCNMMGLGESNAKKLRHINPNTFSANPSVIISLVPSNVSTALLENVEYLDTLISYCKFKDYEESIPTASRFNVVLTGKLSKPRNQLALEYEKRGCTIQGKINNDTDYLIYDGSETSSKYKEAVKRGIKIITENDFYTKL